MSEIDEMAELPRCELTEGGADAERAGKLQCVFDVLEAESEREHDILLMVPVNHAPAVSYDLRACGLAGGDRFGDDLEIELGALCDRDAFRQGGDLRGLDHIDDEFVGGPRADTAKAQDAL